MTIEEMLDSLETIGRRKTDRMVWETVLYYYGSIMLNKYNFRKSTGSKFIRFFAIVFASSGVGKALANSEPVLTSNGWKNMGDLNLKDKVIGSNGKPCQINYIHPQGIRDIYKVSFIDGTNVMCDLNHLWTIKNKYNKQFTLTTKQMLDDGIVTKKFDKRYGTYQNEYSFFTPYSNPILTGSDKDIDIDPYLLGLLLGDGCFRNNNNKISFTNHSIDLINELEKRLPSTDKIGYKKFKQGAWHITIVNKNNKPQKSTLSKLITKYKLNGLKSINKFIPKQYLTASLETRKQLLQGLIDTDGYCRKNGMILEYSTSSMQLSKDFLELGRSLGKVLSIKSRIPKYKYNGIEKKGSRSYRIYERQKTKKGKAIIDISFSHKEEATCISINSKDRLFVTNGYNLTHNSFSMKEVEKMCGLKNYADIMMSYHTTSTALLPETPDDIDEIKRYMPKSITIGVEGTAEGLYQVAQSQKASGFGSLNLATEEFGEAVGSSSGLLSKLKELRDGIFKAKVIKGDHESSMKADIEDIICNFIGLGSKKGVTAESKNELKRIASSGLYRRTFILDSQMMVEKNKVKENTSNLKEYLEALNENFKADFIERRKTDLFSEKFFELDSSYLPRAEEIDDELILRSQNERLNEFAQYDTGSLEIIESLAHIIAFLEWDTTVSDKHLIKAFDFFKRTRITVENTFKSLHPYKSMYDLLKLKDNMTISEMAEFESDIPIAKTKVGDNIELLKELCYRNDEVLIENQGKVTRYRIQTLPTNKLDQLIVSLDIDHKFEKSVHFQSHKLTWEQIKKLVVSEKTPAFTTAHFDEGYRSKKNFIEGQNLIAFDIDEKMTIDEAQEVFEDYTYLIYTTKSHQKEKGDKGIMDRFRIIIPTKTTYYVTEDQHKRMYENIADGLDVHNDTQTKNVSRLWYTNPEAILFENKGELFDVTPFIPDTIKSEKIMPVITNINEQVESGEIDRREAGFIKWFITNTNEGTRNGNLYKAAAFFNDLGLDYASKAIRLNAMLSSPVSDNELSTIISSVKNK